MKKLRRKSINSKSILIATIVSLTIFFGGIIAMWLSSRKLPTPSPSDPVVFSSPVPSVSITPTETNVTQAQHFLYQQADSKQMVMISSYATGEYQRFEFMHPVAAKALMKMIYAARDETVWIVPVSAFRTTKAQETLFKAQIERRGSIEAAKKLSAPPGYSEHHTGLAIDLGDGNFPKQDIKEEFEKTQAYQWMTHHAQEFGFELSFPRNNKQGVSYEPWHWRYVGSSEAVKIFAQARSQK
jgi:D-alanyl-D-alanine carboxypeptidase